jgi:hypothetical protein
MIDAIYEENKRYFNDWISLNPNLYGFSYENNILMTPNNEKINLKYFLVSNLLQNRYFNKNKYSMSAKEFIFIIKINVTANNLINNIDHDKFTNVNVNEFIVNIKILNNKSLLIKTNVNEYLIDTNNYSNIFLIYSDMLKKYNSYVPLNIFLEELKTLNIKLPKNSPINETKVIELFDKTDSYTSSEINYIKKISDFIFQLILNQELLCDSAQQLLDIYNTKMNYLASKNNLNDNEKYIYKLYQENIKKLEDIKKENEQKEALQNKASSLGYSSLALILLTVFVFGIVTSIIFIFN